MEKAARDLAWRYALNEIRVPMMERLGLYERSTGETSDVVEKQMYLVSRGEESQGEDKMALRPEGTPGVVRAYIESGLDRSDPEQRFFYLGPMLRYERPQKGRYRQFHQFGVELFGRPDAAADAELMMMVDELGRSLKLELELQVNSLGCTRCRPAFRAALLDWGRSHLSELCQDCHQRLERNPLRLLDCKIDVGLTEGAPKSLDYLCDDCRRHFETVVQMVDRAEVTYAINARLVRGLDYYTRTAFEAVATGIGAQNAVAAGGRYDGLVEALGGAPVPGTGFAVGIERIALAARQSLALEQGAPNVVLAALGQAAALRAVGLARSLRERGLRVELLSPERGLKALLRRADRVGARYAVIFGDNELQRGIFQLRDLKASSQREVGESELLSAIVDGREN